MIRSERPVAAPAAIVHAVLTDVTAWKLWAPHVASVDCVVDVIRDTAWSGLVKPWLGPAVQMDVTWVEPGRGMRWFSAIRMTARNWSGWPGRREQGRDGVFIESK